MARIELILLASTFLGAYCQSIPEITQNVVRLREDIPIGKFAFKILAIDADNDPLTYRITGENAFYFSVDSVSGNVTIRSPLDREEMETFSVTLHVSDSVYPDVSKNVIIILEDANDNRPIFIDAPYNKDVQENTTVGTLLFHVTARDADSGLASLVSYKIDDVVPSGGQDLFSIAERTGELRLVGNLNYTSKSTFYQIKINASDGGGILHEEMVFQSSSAFAFITVIDVPDLDPQFLNLPYSFSVNENTAVGHSVFQVRAIDPDTGVNDRILYSIGDTNAPDLFQINENTGEILVKTVFDREDLLAIQAVVTLEVLARESGFNVEGRTASAATTVRVSIGDINDNKPKFYKCEAEPCDYTAEESSFHGDVNEHSPVGVAVAGLSIAVRDLDEGVNAKFELHLEGPNKDAFSVSPFSATSSSPVQILIRNPGDVDYEKMKTMVVQVVATDVANTLDCCSTATVTIQINDINDNNPTFQHETYHLEVAEHSPDGTIIDTITATDPDTADVGNITYRLLPESILKYFDVDPKNGSIVVKDEKLIDREVRALYSATLQATDTGNNVGTTVLEITLLDINDMTPEIPRESYIDFVKEGPDGKLFLTIQAFDSDEPDTENSRIQYRIVSSEFSDNFTIDINTGELVNTGELDREAIDPEANGKIELNVTATDMGVPPRSSWVKVIINVEDINDNTPVFNPRSYTFFVKESEVGIYVGSVFAHDRDQTDINNRISFRITDGSFGNFIIITEAYGTSGYIGNISVDPDIELDYELQRKTYLLRVEATDLGQRKDVVVVDVIVLDVNDERPTLPGLTVQVLENTTVPGEVGKFEGKDLDSNHSLIYHLISTECRCNGTLGQCEEEWFTLESTGAVVVNDEFVIDYEKCDQVLIDATVEDVFTEKGDNHSLVGKMTINIIDINDNVPQFIVSDALFVVVTENTEKGTEVATVTATDRDSGKNKEITFDVLSVGFIDTNNITRPLDKIFYAETTEKPYGYEGSIRSLSSLDSSLKGRYLVMVEAKDGGNLRSSTELEIFTIDKSYRVGLRFESSVADVSKNLNQIRGALVSATKATVHILDLEAESAEQRASEITVLGAYFVYPDGTAINSETVERILQEDLQTANILRSYGLTYIVSGVTEVKEIEPVFLFLVGLVAVLVIVLVVMVTSLVCTQRSYKRKLKAAKAMNSAKMLGADNPAQTGAVVPGTNKYTMEGANPVLNMNIDTDTEQSFYEESADKVSLNSLDYSSYLNMTEKDSQPMMRIQEEEDEGTGVSPKYIEPLGAALAQRKKNPSSKNQQVFDNPCFNTTDL